MIVFRTACRYLGIAVALAISGCVATPPADHYLAPAADGTTYDGFLAYGAFKDLVVEGWLVEIEIRAARMP